MRAEISIILFHAAVVGVAEQEQEKYLSNQDFERKAETAHVFVREVVFAALV